MIKPGPVLISNEIKNECWREREGGAEKNMFREMKRQRLGKD